MALHIYTSPDDKNPLSTDGTNPLAFTFDGIKGGAISKKLYIRNNDLTRYYTDISISVNDTGSPSRTDGTEGFKWRLYEGEHHPPLETWASIAPGNSIDLSSGIGTYLKSSISTYLAFWLRIEIPTNRRVQVIDQVYLRFTATEYLIQ